MPASGLRVVLAAHKPGRGNATVSTDLDLVVRLPSGTIAAASRSKDNNFEIVEFVAPVTGSYWDFGIVNVRPSPGQEHLGFAVSRTES